MDNLYNILRGCAIGMANVIPGVSGGTLAVIMGVYEKLTTAIGTYFSDKKNLLKNTIFLLTIGIGAGIGILVFARLFTYLFSSELSKQSTYLFFVGLILGSVPFVAKLHNDMKLTLPRIIAFLVAMALVVVTSSFEGSNQSAKELAVTGEFLGIFKITEFNYLYGIWISVCGLLGAGSMVLPGFSGSALLISLGEYNNVLYFIDQRMLIPLIFLAIGIVPGIVIFARLISLMLKKHPAKTYYFILGLLLASNFQIYTEISDILSFSVRAVILGIICITVGFSVSYLMSRINKG